MRRSESEQGGVLPPCSVSQLRGLREMARSHDSEFDRTVRPSPGQQCADEVERTPEFGIAEDYLWERYVRGFPSMGLRGDQRLRLFHARLRRRWPSGFTGESDAPPPLRSAQIAAIQAEVEAAQEKGRRRSA